MPGARRPLGVFKMTLSHIELAEAAHTFTVLTCGPHWGLTAIVPDSDRPCFNWQASMASAASLPPPPSFPPRFCSACRSAAQWAPRPVPAVRSAIGSVSL